MLTDFQIVRLLDIANAGCHKGLVLQARAIYDGILALKPGHIPAIIGRAMSSVVIGEFEKAEAILRAVLADNADDADAKSVLGLCLMLAGRKEEARDILETLSDNGSEASRLASALLAQMD